MSEFINYDYWKQEVYRRNTIEEFVNNIFANGIHSLWLNEELPIDILIKDSQLLDANEYIMLSFNGAVARNNNFAPFFAFSGISEKIKLPLIAFSDPTLSMSKGIGLSWYAGNEHYPNLPEVLAGICDRIIEVTGKKLLLVGGSGGGFAALNIQTLMKLKLQTKLVVWNPQTDLIAYSQDTVIHYMNTAYPSSPVKANKNNLVDFVENRINYKITHDQTPSRLILMDGYDYNHIRDLKLSFGKIENYMSLKNLIKIDNTTLCFGDWGRFGDGHLPLPRDVAAKIISEVSKGSDYEYVDAVLNETNTTERQLLLLKGRKVDFSVVRVNINFIEDLLEIETNFSELFYGFDLSFRLVENETNKIIYMGKRQNFILRSRDFIKLKNIDLNVKNISNYKLHISVRDFLNTEHILVKQLNFLNCKKYEAFNI